MLDALRLEDAPCFGPGTTEIGPLGKVSFFFGANGAGKTTISESLRDGGREPRAALVWSPRATELMPRVYNRAYVDQTIASGSNLPGVFVLGEGSAEAQQELDELECDGGPIDTAQRALAGLRAQLGTDGGRDGVIGRIAATRAVLSDEAWKGRDRIPGALRPMFEGFNSSKARLLDKVLAVAAEHADNDVDEAVLVTEAASAFDPDASEILALPVLAAVDLESIDGHELLSTPIVGSSDVTLSALIEMLGNDDWVLAGRSYLEHTDGVCPFCQQAAPEDLARHLATYFDQTYSHKVEDLTQFARRYRDDTSRLRSTLAAVDPDRVPQLPTEAFELAVSRLSAVLDENERRLEDKVASPSSSVRLSVLTEHVEAVNALIRGANERIGQHNERVRNRKSARGSLLERCWRHFVRTPLGVQVMAYETAIAPLESKKTGLERSVAASGVLLREAQDRVTSLRAQLRSSHAVADSINEMLASVGFSSFVLAPADDDAGGYQLVREGGLPAAATLSEGERTFVTFLYFVHQLRHLHEDAAQDRNLLVVIDDPISSLDSDILFVVSSLTRRIVQSAHQPDQRIKQVVVLTHNTQFHKEITYARRGDKSSETAYFAVRKSRGGPSIVMRSLSNPVTSSYRALWEQVRAASVDSSRDSVGLENVLRRIVENYFTTVGISDDALVDRFPAGQQVVCRSLFSWMNDGSHTIMDDLHYAPSGLSTEIQLEVFRKVFDYAGHASHYEMMMRAELSAPSGSDEGCDDGSPDEPGVSEAVVIELPA